MFTRAHTGEKKKEDSSSAKSVLRPRKGTEVTFFFFLLQSLPFLFLGVEQKKKEEGNYRNVPSFERAAAP